MSTLKTIGYPFGAAVAASLAVLLIGGVVFGFPFAEWAEWEGRVVGIVATIAGIAGAAFGFLKASSAERQGIR